MDDKSVDFRRTLIKRRGALAASLVCALAACGGDPSGVVCPTGWNHDSSAPGGCAPPASFTSSLPPGVYGFVRTTKQDSSPAAAGNELVAGATVYVLVDSNTTCGDPSVNPVAETTTSQDGVFSMSVTPGKYHLTSSAVTSCLEVSVGANASDVPLTSP